MAPQKVITIQGISHLSDEHRQESRVIESVYPELQKYLDEGYKVIAAYPMQSSGTTSSFTFAITFVLDAN